MNHYLEEMEAYARLNKIPVILPETREYLCSLVKKRKPKTILEIGMAIGFSASCMLLSCEQSKVIDVEASLPNIALARKNFEALGLTNRVQIIEGDCMQELPKLVAKGEKYDMIFLDGPKGQYHDMINLILPLLKDDGIWVSDNVLFRGMVRGSVPIDLPKHQRTVNVLRSFIQDLESNNSLNTNVLEIGDGLMVVTKKEKNNEV